jgi:outer membrane receptor protein involved in Fe transport
MALDRLLKGTGLIPSRDPSGVVTIVPGHSSMLSIKPEIGSIQLAQATPSQQRAAVETVTVTSSKLGGADVQSIPIAITALSQEQLTATQTAGGPDLVKQVPNLTFTKTNFTGYSIQVRGIGTQAISVTTDPAVAVAFNDTPFIRNHFFEQEFYDLSQVEVLRGPQGTLYGRNATAGVVNITSAKPTDQFEAMASGDIGNYKNRRFEGMINIPFVSDKLDLRVAGEWTKRDGYTFNELTDSQVDGRDLWSTRTTLRWKPVESFHADLVWEHFQENDDRLRSGKQLCKTDPGPQTLTAADGTVISPNSPRESIFNINAASFSQGCLPSSLYSNDAFGVPNGFSLPFISGLAFIGFLNPGVDPYTDTRQSTNLRNTQSSLAPIYKAKNDTLELNATWNVSPSLTFYSDTGYNRDFLWSTQDFNRFNTAGGIFKYDGLSQLDLAQTGMQPDPAHPGAGIFCDPQLGCSDRLIIQDLAEERSWQLSQEFRLASAFKGPLNFSAGGNYMHYETSENYYVFSNALSIISLNNVGCGDQYVPGVTNNLYCLTNGRAYRDPHLGGGVPTESPQYVDPNPITSLDNEGHNYFVSQNPYVLNSYALFGEAYYDISPDLKFTGGLRWTDDQKHFVIIPSQVIAVGYGYPSIGVADKSWEKFTGRAVLNWTPKLDFTDQSMFYASFAHGYKAGGQNPPAPVLTVYGSDSSIKFPVHPVDFNPEFINAYELGTKNSLLDGGLTLNGDVFFYDYKGYQISQIVDRTSINVNFDATVRGAELEATWEPLPGLKFTFAGGYEHTRINNNQYAIDLIDRTAGHSDWVVMKPWAGASSNCVFPAYVAATLVVNYSNYTEGNQGPLACGYAYTQGVDPVTLGYYHSSWGGAADPANNLVPGQPYYEIPAGLFTPVEDHGYPVTVSDYQGNFPSVSYPGFDPSTAPNGGEGFEKNVGGNELPNAPHFTVSLGADYTMPVSPDWAATLHGDFYWQDKSWARVFNDDPYDRIHGYTNVNLALILTDTSGWQVMGYVKNVFDTTAITGDFLNSDDTGLTTNIFLTDPRLFGVRVTKHFEGGSSGGDGLNFFSDAKDHTPQLWVQFGGNFNANFADATSHYNPLGTANFPNGGSATPPWQQGLPTPADLQKTPRGNIDTEAAVTIQPDGSDWMLKAGVRYGRSSYSRHTHKSMYGATRISQTLFNFFQFSCPALASVEANVLGYTSDQIAAADLICKHGYNKNFADAQFDSSESHTIIDFELGKDVGIGEFNREGTNTLSAGVRIAQFGSRSDLVMGAQPYYHLEPAKADTYRLLYDFYSYEKRSFRGIGPEVGLDSSMPVLGDINSGRVTIDWGFNLGVLFGTQKVNLHHIVKDCRVPGGSSCSGQYIDSRSSQDDRTTEPPDDVLRTSTVTVPNIGAHLGASVQYQNAKISLGYRADTFFNAMDGGQETAKDYNRGFYGPYLNVTLGLGG